MTSTLVSTLGITHPIVQAPMGGANATPPGLVAAVGNAGGLGFIGAAYMSPEQIVRESSAIRAQTVHPFGINLFAPVETPARPTNVDLQGAITALTPYHDELGLPAPAAPPAPAFGFDDQLSAAVECGARVFSFTFGQLPPSAMRALKARGMYVIGTATTVDEAMLLERSGVDAIAAQGSEAGAHRGTFAAPFDSAMIGTMALVAQIVRAVRVPVLASGGIMTGRGIAAALALGAAAVQMGTAFLTTHECGVAESHKRAILDATEDATRITRAFSGRPARGIVNRAMTEIELAPGAILPYPYQNSLTRAMRNAASQQDRAEFLSLWAGQGVRMARRMGAADLVRTLVAES
jgi:nitronate monooxygenase